MNNINEILIKIKEMDYDKETCIAELISYNPKFNFVEPIEQMKLLRQVHALAEENNIFLEENMEEKGGLGFYVKFKKIKNNFETNNYTLNELIEKLDQNINSSLSYDEQIQNINKRIEELNNEEDK